jgi:S-adenosylmethionine hydrolase
MAIITLTTDFGTSDHYVAVLKALILKSNPAQIIVDINHEIRPFDIIHGAITLKHMYHEFPLGTIHIIGINAEPEINFNNPEESMMPCIVKHNGHYFVGNDNGIFSLIFGGKQPDEIYEISELSSPDLLVFPPKTILVPTALKILEGIPLDEIVTKKDKVRRALSISPVIETHTIKGIIVHVDHYGNLMTNITKDEFQRVGGTFNFKIRFRSGSYIIEEISYGYNEVPQGEKLAIFNDFGYLEIAINKGVVGNGGGASGLFGMKINDPITIEFFPPGSKQTLESLFG